MTDEEYQIRRKYENRNLMQELKWVSHYPPSGMSDQDKDFIRWLAMTAYDRINELERKWIPVTERLPEPNAVDKYGFAKGYLVKTDRHVMMHTARYTGEWWILWGYHKVITDNVTHWMPLPVPPKGDE